MHDLQSPIKSTIHLLSEVEANALYSKKQTNKQTNKNKKKAYLETSEFNTKEDFFYIPLSTGDREKNEVIMTNRINHKNANNLQFLWLELHKQHLEQKVILPLTSPLDINVPTRRKLAS